jgi:hypothetical protein
MTPAKMQRGLQGAGNPIYQNYAVANDLDEFPNLQLLDKRVFFESRKMRIVLQFAKSIRLLDAPYELVSIAKT